MPNSSSLKEIQVTLGDLKYHLTYVALFYWFLSVFASTVWAKKTNVIIIMTDDQGYGDLGCHGNRFSRPPNLDQLHSESVRFTDFHVSPFCTPTRAALMTGNHPGVTGAYRTSAGRTMLHPSEKTIANHFAENGYKTNDRQMASGRQCSTPSTGPEAFRMQYGIVAGSRTGIRSLGK